MWWSRLWRDGLITGLFIVAGDREARGRVGAYFGPFALGSFSPMHERRPKGIVYSPGETFVHQGERTYDLGNRRLPSKRRSFSGRNGSPPWESSIPLDRRSSTESMNVHPGEFLAPLGRRSCTRENEPGENEGPSGESAVLPKDLGAPERTTGGNRRVPIPAGSDR